MLNLENRISRLEKYFEDDNQDDIKNYLNVEYLNNAFDRFNKLFFKNKITKIPVIIKNSRELAGGYCEYNSRGNKIKAKQICVYNKVFKDRITIENILIHEMCHAYQSEILCKGNLSLYTADCDAGQGSSGHGPKFFKAAELVNNSTKNTEGYKVAQYYINGTVKNKAYKDLSGAFAMFLYGLNVYTAYYNKNDLKNNDTSDESLFKYKDGEVKTFIVDTFEKAITKNSINTDNKNLFKLCEFINNKKIVNTENTDKNVICIYKDKTFSYKAEDEINLNDKNYKYYIYSSILEPLRYIKYDSDTINISMGDKAKLKELINSNLLIKLSNKNNECINYTLENDNQDDNYNDHDSNIELLDSLNNIDVEENDTYDVIIVH